MSRIALVQRNNLMALTKAYNADRIIDHKDGTASIVVRSVIFGPFRTREEAVHMFNQERLVSR